MAWTSSYGDHPSHFCYSSPEWVNVPGYPGSLAKRQWLLAGEDHSADRARHVRFKGEHFMFYALPESTRGHLEKSLHLTNNVLLLTNTRLIIEYNVNYICN